MSDPWINRLEISGPAKDLAAVERAMTPVTAAGSRSRRLDLSFKALSEYLAIGCVICAEEVTDPWGVTVERRESLERGMVRRIYRFEQARYEPDELLVGLSARFPRLCFVLGWVVPDSEEASKLIHKGTARRFDLSAKRKEEIYPVIDDDEDQHVAFWMAVEATGRPLTRSSPIGQGPSGASSDASPRTISRRPARSDPVDPPGKPIGRFRGMFTVSRATVGPRSVSTTGTPRTLCSDKGSHAFRTERSSPCRTVAMPSASARRRPSPSRSVSAVQVARSRTGSSARGRSPGSLPSSAGPTPRNASTPARCSP